MKDHVESSHLTKFDASRVNRGSVWGGVSPCRLSVKLLCRLSFRPLSVAGKSQLIFLPLVGNFLCCFSFPLHIIVVVIINIASRLRKY